MKKMMRIDLEDEPLEKILDSCTKEQLQFTVSLGSMGKLRIIMAVINKVSWKSKDHVFILFKHLSGARKALKQPEDGSKLSFRRSGNMDHEQHKVTRGRQDARHAWLHVGHQRCRYLQRHA